MIDLAKKLSDERQWFLLLPFAIVYFNSNQETTIYNYIRFHNKNHLLGSLHSMEPNSDDFAENAARWRNKYVQIDADGKFCRNILPKY